MKISNLFLIVCTFWIVSEILLLVLRRSKKGSQDKDLGSVKRLNLVIYISITVGILISFTKSGYIGFNHFIIQLIGFVLIVFGLVIRWLAILTLRRFFTVNVAIHADHIIVQTGFYKYIRHPSYLGMLLSFFGLGLCLSNLISIGVMLIPITFALVNRIQIEERALHDAFGNDYLKYCSNTWRLIPWVY
ncbi:MAG: methyltransferase family protein [Ignavibacteriaceae bacterium]